MHKESSRPAIMPRDKKISARRRWGEYSVLSLRRDSLDFISMTKLSFHFKSFFKMDKGKIVIEGNKL